MLNTIFWAKEGKKPFLFKICADQVIRHVCTGTNEALEILTSLPQWTHRVSKGIKKYGVTHRLSTKRYHPSKQVGQVEVSNRGLKRSLKGPQIKVDFPHVQTKNPVEWPFTPSRKVFPYGTVDFLKPTRAQKFKVKWSIRDKHYVGGNEPHYGSGYQQKDRKPSQNDKTEHGMEKTVQNQGQSPKMPKSESILKNQQSNRSRN
ncbi:hypothetical protein Tco_0653959 [Tanacetum coccineum]|uniref:Uncharacterized protein n=1 Tax=Tanacetum coccineum TaxID=301880 RepID=A0ABQ4X219_9ASTR